MKVIKKDITIIFPHCSSYIINQIRHYCVLLLIMDLIAFFIYAVISRQNVSLDVLVILGVILFVLGFLWLLILVISAVSGGYSPQIIFYNRYLKSWTLPKLLYSQFNTVFLSGNKELSFLMDSNRMVASISLACFDKQSIEELLDELGNHFKKVQIEDVLEGVYTVKVGKDR